LNAFTVLILQHDTALTQAFEKNEHVMDLTKGEYNATKVSAPKATSPLLPQHAACAVLLQPIEIYSELT